jgi:magnesium-transporting ATPase (P-type)
LALDQITLYDTKSALRLFHILSIDTASITGEPLPRNYPSEQYGALILTGTTVKAGEAYCIVRKTGINTEVRDRLSPTQKYSD